MPSCVDFDEPGITQQFKRMKLCDEEDEPLETEEFDNAVTRSSLDVRTSGQIKLIMSSGCSSCSVPSVLPTGNSIPSFGTIGLPGPLAGTSAPMFSMGPRLKKLEKKRSIKKEASIVLTREKPRKSLFSNKLQ